MMEIEKRILQLFSYVNEIENIEQRRRFIFDLQEILNNLKFEPVEEKNESLNDQLNNSNFQKLNNDLIPFWFLTSLKPNNKKDLKFNKQEISNKKDIEDLIEEIANTIFNSKKNMH